MPKCEFGNMSYTQYMDYAESRYKRGDRQVWCPQCFRWVWPDMVAEEHKASTLTKKQFDKIAVDARKLAMDDVFWVVRHGTPVLTTTLGIKRSWHHLRSGSTEWKEQCPRKFDKESQAWWHILMCEVSHEKWTGWHAANGRGQMIDHVRDTHACERIYDVCCKYHRAVVRELTPKKEIGNG